MGGPFPIFLEILAILSLTAINGLLAMSELAVVSSRKSRLEQMAGQGDSGARAALRLINDPSRFLSSVQIGITLIGIVAGAFSGATIGQRMGAWLNTFAGISPHGNSVGIGITVVGITYLSLIIGELVPKRVALANPEEIASRIAKPMAVLSLAAAPAVWLLHVSTETILKLAGLGGSRETSVTEDEVKSLIAEGTLAGIFAPQEQAMIEGVLRLADRSVRVIMTPRTRIVWVDVESDPETIIRLVGSHHYSRLLVCNGSIDRPIGFVHTKHLVSLTVGNSDVRLSEITTPLLCVPDRTSALLLLNRFKKEKIHIAVVVDEYGTTEGLVTITDILEAIAGDLPERGEESSPAITRRSDGSWLVDGNVPTDEVTAVTGIDMGGKVVMLAGFLLDHMGRIPRAGDGFQHGNAWFEVVDMDGNRIDKVLIQANPEKQVLPDPPI
jgi:putative hemolysin